MSVAIWLSLFLHYALFVALMFGVSSTLNFKPAEYIELSFQHSQTVAVTASTSASKKLESVTVNQIRQRAALPTETSKMLTSVQRLLFPITQDSGAFTSPVVISSRHFKNLNSEHAASVLASRQILKSGQTLSLDSQYKGRPSAFHSNDNEESVDVKKAKDKEEESVREDAVLEWRDDNICTNTAIYLRNANAQTQWKIISHPLKSRVFIQTFREGEVGFVPDAPGNYVLIKEERTDAKSLTTRYSITAADLQIDLMWDPPEIQEKFLNDVAITYLISVRLSPDLPPIQQIKIPNINETKYSLKDVDQNTTYHLTLQKLVTWRGGTEPLEDRSHIQVTTCHKVNDLL